MIKTVIFDLGGVIVPLDFARGYAALERSCGYPAADIPGRIRASNLVPRYETGQMTTQEFTGELSRVLALQTSHEEFCEMWSSILLPHTLIPELFLASIARRYRMLLLSNTNPLHFEWIRERFPLLRHFDEFVLSYEVGAVKPSARIYEAALAKAECKPEECFYTDDILPYVEGAKRAGIQAAQFAGFEQLQRDMKSAGIEWS